MAHQGIKKQKGRIGIFDSGFGGLDVMRQVVKKNPAYDYIYLGDTARVPYGNRSAETICAFTRQAVDFLFRQGCELIILACNTASSDALRVVQQQYLPGGPHWKKRVLGVLIPGAEEAVSQSRSGRIGIMATFATVASGAFPREIKKLDSRAKVFQAACPLLVPIVESGEGRSPIAALAIKKYVAPLKKKKVDTVILGCTHYGLLKKKISRSFGPGVKVISEPEAVAKKLADYLRRHPEIETRLEKKSRRYFFSTDRVEDFERLGSRFLGKKFRAKKAEL